MKASEWLTWLQRAASYTLDGLFSSEENNELIHEIIHIFNSIGRKEHRRSELGTLRKHTLDTLARWEDQSPDYVQPVLLHLLFHLVDFIHEFGPVNISWMFPNERFLGRLGRIIYRNSEPEINLVNNVLRYSAMITSTEKPNPILQQLQDTAAG